ncbi:hypothetical protein DICPUDRAFT_151087 [Dictyostelium purpureum]|uniref:Uncharacterized protein n=1 Tax=Dictyostelium purpureum TaxID=5786 RepID=F0ZHY8_DICPU|nr:uncharacterized protein DICPUDRAFT_151087 [Dictyostelium purpureum]EGC36454.1 hypothetical protein DICPUDRAFT_151087 [Dictyostelium purpureum]|eukprot:XP_003287026.1 hypothetical protein DICPUDRAFT_151087 [Dictyostelium purpureum]
MTIFATLSKLGNSSVSKSSKVLSSSSVSSQSSNSISCDNSCGSGVPMFKGPSGRSYTLEQLVAIGIAHTTAFVMSQLSNMTGGSSISSMGSIKSNKNETLNNSHQNICTEHNKSALLGLGISKLVSGLLNTVSGVVSSVGL